VIERFGLLKHLQLVAG